MRWRRPLKRLLMLLMFACMTIKLHLELRLLDASGDKAMSVWRSNDTLKTAAGFFGIPMGPGTSSEEKQVLESPLAEGAGENASVIQLKPKGGKDSPKPVVQSREAHKVLPPVDGSKYNNRKLTNDNSEAGAKPAAKPADKKAAAPKPPERPKGRPITRKVAPKKGVSHDVDTKEVSLSKEDIVRIRMEMDMENKLQTVYNEKQYGPVLPNTTILLVQVHKRLENLRYLVEGMTKVRDIEKALVIFSHDFWDHDINTFVTNITKFRVMQIFFPYSIQLHPLTFPGRDPRDCSWNINRQGPLKCLNRAWPDSYGHYREASFTQIKHHWWWKIHRVFEGLNVTRNYTGHVVFLEEDHYVSPDLLHVLSLMQRDKKKTCPTCQVLALGNYNKMSTAVYRNYIERGDWWVTKHNLGFALDINAWNIISKCKEQFCNFDDYNWDWTLNNMEHTCFKPRLSMLSVRFSRVVHVGSCGTHVKKSSCDVRREVLSAVNRFSSGKQWLFPSSLVLQTTYRGAARSKKGNGGWGDFRDKELCRAIGNGTASEETLTRLQFPDRQ